MGLFLATEDTEGVGRDGAGDTCARFDCGKLTGLGKWSWRFFWVEGPGLWGKA